jgi:hypothetical protein
MNVFHTFKSEKRLSRKAFRKAKVMAGDTGHSGRTHVRRVAPHDVHSPRESLDYFIPAVAVRVVPTHEARHDSIGLGW